MTQLETDKELIEIFEHKAALTDKINTNTKIIYQAEKTIKGEENEREKEKLREITKRYKYHLDCQIKERQRLALPKVAKQLDLKVGKVRRRYMTFLGNRDLCG